MRIQCIVKDQCLQHEVLDQSPGLLAALTLASHPSFAGLVVLAGSLYPIPSRTRPLNSPAPMVLSLKTWKSRSLPGLPRTESSSRSETTKAAAASPRRLFFCAACQFAGSSSGSVLSGLRALPDADLPDLPDPGSITVATQSNLDVERVVPACQGIPPVITVLRELA